MEQGKLITFQDIIKGVIRISDEISKHEEYLNELDAIVGDGEHGLNLNRAFKRVRKKLLSSSFETPSEVLKTIGMELIASGGGAGATFYGVAFLAASKRVEGDKYIKAEKLSELFEAALDKIKQRGKAKQGEKTLVDALLPATQRIQKAQNTDSNELLEIAATAAKNGAISTKNMKGQKGRSLYAGERALGVPDPGAVSTYIILSALADVLPDIPITS